jgi:hypothetical protein
MTQPASPPAGEGPVFFDDFGGPIRALLFISSALRLTAGTPQRHETRAP